MAIYTIYLIQYMLCGILLLRWDVTLFKHLIKLLASESKLHVGEYSLFIVLKLLHMKIIILSNNIFMFGNA